MERKKRTRYILPHEPNVIDWDFVCTAGPRSKHKHNDGDLWEKMIKQTRIVELRGLLK